MSNAITAVSQAMLSDLERLRVISHNMANVSTPGFRAERPVEGRFEGVVSNRLAGVPTRSLTVATDKAGGVRETSRNLDVAIDGPAFLQVDTGDSIVYTRRGDLRLDAGGRLITESGHPVVGTAGEIVLTGDDAEIDARGVITQRGQAVGQLALVEFGPEAVLQPLSSGLLASSVTPDPATQSTVLGRHLETSNVDVVSESLRLVEVSRHASYIGQVIRGYDQILNAAINTLGTSR